MSRQKLSIVGVLVAVAALAISAFASASAFASFELSSALCSGGTFDNVCWETAEKGTALKELVGEIPFEALLDKGVNFEFLVPAISVSILCEVAHVSPTKGLFLQASPLTANGTVDATIEFEGCAVTGALKGKCKTAVTNETVPLTGTWSLTTHGEITFKPTSGSIFIEVPLENEPGKTECPTTVAGKHPVKIVEGTTGAAATLTEPLVDLKAHLLEVHEKQPNLLFLNDEVILDEFWVSVEIPEETAWDLENEA
jgi:hypothetical protein